MHQLLIAVKVLGHRLIQSLCLFRPALVLNRVKCDRQVLEALRATKSFEYNGELFGAKLAVTQVKSREQVVNDKEVR